MEEQVFLQSSIIQTLRVDNEDMAKSITKQEDQITVLRKSCYSMDKQIKKLKKETANLKQKLRDKKEMIE